MSAYNYACLCSIFLFTFFTTLFAQDQPLFVRSACSDTNYTRNSTYSSNLKTLLSSLSNSDNTTFSNGFQFHSFGEADTLVSGFFLCRGDRSPEKCRDCVVFGVNNTLTYRCIGRKEAMNYYEYCTIRYADRNVLLDRLDIGGIWMVNDLNVTENQLVLYSDLLLSLMSEATYEAAESSRKVAVKKANTILSQKIYVMAQCIPVLTRENCITCLRRIIDVLPRGRVGGRILRWSCFIRYELYPFYDETFMETHLPPPVSAPPQLEVSVPPKPGKGKSSTVTIIAIVVSFSVLLFVAVYYLCARKAKKTYDTAAAANDGSLQFDFKVMEAATNKFSENNKLGEGGFGEVFKVYFARNLTSKM